MDEHFGCLSWWMFYFLVLCAVFNTGWTALAFAVAAALFLIAMRIVQIIEKRSRK
jgi:hypothetical protein